MPGGRGLNIEMKPSVWNRLEAKDRLCVMRDAGEPSGDQLAFMDTMAAACGLGVVWSPEGVAALIRSAK